MALALVCAGTAVGGFAARSRHHAAMVLSLRTQAAIARRLTGLLDCEALEVVCCREGQAIGAAKARAPLDGSVVLLDNVVQVLGLPQCDFHSAVGDQAAYCRRVSPRFCRWGRSRAHHAGRSRARRNVAQQPHRGEPSAGSPRSARACRRGAQVLPLAADQHIGFVDLQGLPTGCFRPRNTAASTASTGSIAVSSAPCESGCVVDDHTALGHHLFEVAQAQRVAAYQRTRTSMISSGKCIRLITRRSVEFVSWTCKGTMGRFSPTAFTATEPKSSPPQFGSPFQKAPGTPILAVATRSATAPMPSRPEHARRNRQEAPTDRSPQVDWDKSHADVAALQPGDDLQEATRDSAEMLSPSQGSIRNSSRWRARIADRANPARPVVGAATWSAKSRWHLLIRGSGWRSQPGARDR